MQVNREQLQAYLQQLHEVNEESQKIGFMDWPILQKVDKVYVGLQGILNKAENLQEHERRSLKDICEKMSPSDIDVYPDIQNAIGLLWKMSLEKNLGNFLYHDERGTKILELMPKGSAMCFHGKEPGEVIVAFVDQNKTIQKIALKFNLEGNIVSPTKYNSFNDFINANGLKSWFVVFNEMAAKQPSKPEINIEDLPHFQPSESVLEGKPVGTYIIKKSSGSKLKYSLWAVTNDGKIKGLFRFDDLIKMEELLAIKDKQGWILEKPYDKDVENLPYFHSNVSVLKGQPDGTFIVSDQYRPNRYTIVVAIEGYPTPVCDVQGFRGLKQAFRDNPDEVKQAKKPLKKVNPEVNKLPYNHGAIDPANIEKMLTPGDYLVCESQERDFAFALVFRTKEGTVITEPFNTTSQLEALIKMNNLSKPVPKQ